MKKFSQINRTIKEETDTTEKVEMTQSQLHFIHYACEEILDYIDQGGEVEEWYQVKVAKSFSEFESLHSFIEGEKRRTGMVKEGADYKVTVSHLKADKTISKHDYDVKNANDTRHAKNIAINRHTDKHGLKPGEQIYSSSQDVKLMKEESELEEGLMKTIKRSVAGWGTFNKEKPKDVVNKVKGQDTDVLKRLHEPNTKKGKGSPAELQQKAIGRELKKRGVAEEVEQLDELSSKTLNSYSKKATKDAWRQIMKSDFKKGDKRLSGVVKATEKMKKEEAEQLDELSKKTLGNYIKSATHDVAAKAAATRQHSVDAHRKNTEGDFTGARDSMKKSDKSFSDSWKRRNNMAKAVDRLTKEEIAIENQTDAGRSLKEKPNKESMSKMKTPLAESRKAEIVKEIVKKKKNEIDLSKGEKFQPEPVLTSQIVKEDK